MNSFLNRAMITSGMVVSEDDLLTHEYRQGDVVTCINSPSTRNLRGKDLTVVKMHWKDDGKYVTVRTGNIEADVHVKLIDSARTK